MINHRSYAHNLSSCEIRAWSIMSSHLSLQFKYMIFFAFPCIFTIWGYIMNSQRGQLPVGLIAQLVEHCTSIAEVMGSNPVKA